MRNLFLHNELGAILLLYRTIPDIGTNNPTTINDIECTLTQSDVVTTICTPRIAPAQSQPDGVDTLIT